MSGPEPLATGSSVPDRPGESRPADGSGALLVQPLAGIGEVREGDDLGELLLAAIEQSGAWLQDGDVLVVSSKIVSKAAGLRVPETPAGVDKQSLVLQHSRRVVTEREIAGQTTRVVQAVAGPVMAAAGIDASNTGPQGGLLLLPDDPDAAATALLEALLAAWEARSTPEGLGEERSPAPPRPRLGVVLSDTAGRPWRAGQVDFALGAAGVQVLDDRRGGVDADGRDLSVTARASADEIAAAADLVKGKDAGVPAALVRGLPVAWTGVDGGARDLVRAGPENWFAFGQAEAVRSSLGIDPASPVAQRVGLPGPAPGPVADRLARAIRVALADPGTTDTTRAGTDADPESAPVAQVVMRTGVDAAGVPVLEVDGAGDPYLAGRLVARLEVALHSEALAGPLLHGLPAPVRVIVQR